MKFFIEGHVCQLYRKSLILLLAAFSICFSSCTKNERETFMAHVNICVLGNSYSNDSFCYVPFILKQYGISCTIHIYCRGAGSLKNLDSEWDQSNSSTFHYSIDTRSSEQWSTTSYLSPKELLTQEKWDIVSIQQASLQVELEDSYSPYLEDILDKIMLECPYKPEISWFMAYNRADDDANDINLKVQQQVVSRSGFGFVFPVATAIFNCQANSRLAKIGDSVYGKLYAKDNVHLQEGLPCYIAALTVAEAILRKYAPSKSIYGDKIRPTQEWIESIGGIAPNGQSVGVNDENCLLAQKAAICANDHMFEIIPVE